MGWFPCAAAVLGSPNPQGIYVVGDDDVAERREIKTGVQIGDLQLVESGLSADERVVVTGIHKVIAGQAVVAK